MPDSCDPDPEGDPDLDLRGLAAGRLRLSSSIRPTGATGFAGAALSSPLDVGRSVYVLVSGLTAPIFDVGSRMRSTTSMRSLC